MAELFKWIPSFHEEWNSSDEWNTIVSKYENHVTQRRAKWSRRYGKWKLKFSKEVATSTADDIMDFFNACRGRAQSFYLPSWKGEFNLSVAHTAPFSTGTITLTSSSTIASRLTTTVGQRGNFIHMSDNNWGSPSGDVFQITNINSNILTATRVAGTNSSYPINTLINICYEAYFVNDALTQDNVLPILFSTGIDFEEK